MAKKRKNFIREKRIYCGEEYLEVDIVAVTNMPEAGKGKKGKSSQAQKNLNDKRSKRRFVQIANTNFGTNDFHISATYNNEHLPMSLEEAEKNVHNYLDRIKRKMKRETGEDLKYMLVTEYTPEEEEGQLTLQGIEADDKTTKAVRIHHHIIINSGGLDRDDLELMWSTTRINWKKANDPEYRANVDYYGFVNCDRLQPNENGLEGIVNYINMGYILAEDYDKKVLIIDNDKQGNLSKACGVWDDEAPSFADVLTGDKTLTDVMQLGANGNIAVVPANMSLLTANLEVIKNEEIDQVTILSKELEKVKDVFDYCIIDCPPDINISVINALVAADEVIIPIKIDGYAFDGMKELEEQINNAKQLNPKLKFRGCLVTMFYNRDVCRQGEEYLQNQRYPVFKTHIRRTEKADEVTFTTQSLMQYSPRSGAARDYKTFVKEYLEG